MSSQLGTSQLRIGMVTTVADAAPHIGFFLRYHFSIGVSHIFVYVDDNCMDTFNQCRSFDSVTTILRNSPLQEHWRELPPYFDSYKRGTIDSEVMTRQELNVYHAALHAKLMGMDWLIHIDLDELFYPNQTNLQNHFKTLSSQGIGCLIYQNYEAIQTRPDSENIYQSTPYFKINYFRRGSLVYSKKQREFLALSEKFDDFYFNYYQNGKSAFSLSDEINVQDVHYIRNVSENTRFGKATDPLILHYPCASYSEFKRKYQTLGHFSDKWNSKPRAGKFISTFHLRARDVLLTGSESALKDLYESKMILKKDFILQLIEQNLAVRIDSICNFVHEPNRSYGDTVCGTRLNRISSDFPSTIEKGKIKLVDRTSELFESLPDECFVRFRSEKDATKWLRRHPIYKKDEHVTVYENGDFSYVLVESSKLLDFSQEITRTMFETVLRRALKNGFIQIKVTSVFDFLNVVDNTGHNFRLKQVKQLVELYRFSEPELLSNLIVEIVDDLRPFLSHISGIKIANGSVVEIANKAIVARQPQLFFDYIKRAYPLNKGVCSCIDITSVANVGLMFPIYIDTLFFLGGTIIYDESLSQHLQDSVALYSKNVLLPNCYAKVKDLSNHDKLLILEKNNGQLKYYLLSNYSNKAISFRTAELDVEGKMADDVKKNKKFIIPKEINLPPVSSLLLKLNYKKIRKS